MRITQELNVQFFELFSSFTPLNGINISMFRLHIFSEFTCINNNQWIRTIYSMKLIKWYLIDAIVHKRKLAISPAVTITVWQQSYKWMKRKKTAHFNEFYNCKWKKCNLFMEMKWNEKKTFEFARIYNYWSEFIVV